MLGTVPPLQSQGSALFVTCKQWHPPMVPWHGFAFGVKCLCACIIAPNLPAFLSLGACWQLWTGGGYVDEHGSIN